MSDVSDNMGIPQWEFRLVLGRTRIEFDPDKEAVNRKIHGYSLLSAVSILEQKMLPVPGPPLLTSEGFQENGEVRHMHLGVDDAGEVVLFVTTMRADETVRIISFRRASESERDDFARHTGYVRHRRD